MAKTKRKRSGGSPTSPNLTKQIDGVCISAMRTGETPGIYQKSYQLSSEDKIRELEAQSSPTQLYAIRTWLFADLHQVRKFRNIPALGRYNFIDDDKGWRESLIIAAGILLGYLASPINIGDFSTQLKRIAEVEKAFPDAFHQDDLITQAKSQINMHLYDHTTRAIYSMCDWQKIFPEQRESLWNKNLQTIIKAIALPEKIEIMESYHDQIINSIVEAANDIIRLDLRSDDNPLPFLVGGQQYSSILLPPAPPNVRLLSNKPLLPNIEEIAKIKQQITLDSKPTTTNEKSFSYLDAFCSSMGTVNPTNQARFVRAVKDIPHVAVIYAAFKNFTERNSISYPTMLTDILFILCFADRFVSAADRDTLSQFQTDETKVMKLTSSKELPFAKALKQQRDEYKKELVKTKGHASNFSTNSTTLWYLTGTETGTILPEELTIDMGMEQTFLDVGYSAREAAALCGFFTATDHGNDAIRMLNAFWNLDDDDEDEETEDNETISNEQTIDNETIDNMVRSKIEQELTQLKSQVNAELDSERRRHMREQRQAYHAQSEAEENARKLAEENESLKDRINELERIISQLEDQIPPPDEADEPELTNAIDICWPCEFGANESILCCGGSDNWIKRQQERFPNVRFYGPQTIPDDTAIAHADLIFINTFVFKHKTFWPIQNAAKKAGTPLKNFPAAGINTSSEFMYRTCLDMFTNETRQ